MTPHDLREQQLADPRSEAAITLAVLASGSIETDRVARVGRSPGRRPAECSDEAWEEIKQANRAAWNAQRRMH